MYQIKPILTKQEIDLPSCMYKIKPVVESLHSDSSTSAGKSDNSPLSVLEEKQNRILKKLDELRQTLLSMRTECQAKSAVVASKPAAAASKQPKSSQNLQSSSASPDLSQLKEIVINAHPSNVPYSIVALKSLWKALVNIEVAIFTHSSVKDSDFSPAARDFASKVTSSSAKNSLPTLKLTIIWKNVPVTEFLVSSAKFVPILGEANIIRFFNRVGPSAAAYEQDVHLANQTDSLLDTCQLLSLRPAKNERASYVNTLSSKLGKSQYFLNAKDVSVADVAVFSTLKNVYGNNVKELPANLSSWLQKVSKTLGY